jgi:hypothetical protein
MSYDENIYYSPEKLGLSTVAEIDWSDGCYQFDLRVVWKHDASGVLYTARDSGCSCPSPFEDYNGIESLERVGPSFRDDIRSEFDGADNTSIAEYEDFLRAIDKALGVIEQEGLVRR